MGQAHNEKHAESLDMALGHIEKPAESWARSARVSHTTVIRLRSEVTTHNRYELPGKRLGKDGKERVLPKPKKSDPPASAPEPPPSSKRQLTIADVPKESVACVHAVCNAVHMVSEERTGRIVVRASATEMAMLRKLAEDEGVTASDFLRLFIRKTYAEKHGTKKPKP